MDSSGKPSLWADLLCAREDIGLGYIDVHERHLRLVKQSSVWSLTNPAACM